MEEEEEYEDEDKDKNEKEDKNLRSLTILDNSIIHCISSVNIL